MLKPGNRGSVAWAVAGPPAAGRRRPRARRPDTVTNTTVSARPCPPCPGKSGHSRRDGTHPHTPPGARPAAADHLLLIVAGAATVCIGTVLALVPRPARHPHRGRLPAAGATLVLDRRGRPIDAIAHQVPHRHPLRARCPRPAPGLCRRRGQPLLGAHRPGRLVHRPGRDQQPARRPPQPGAARPSPSRSPAACCSPRRRATCASWPRRFSPTASSACSPRRRSSTST